MVSGSASAVSGSGVAVIAGAFACLAVICGWVWRAYGRTACAVTASFGAAALICIRIAYEVLPVEQWRAGSLPRSLAVFAVPALAALILYARVRRDDPAVAHPPDAALSRPLEAPVPHRLDPSVPQRLEAAVVHAPGSAPGLLATTPRLQASATKADATWKGMGLIAIFWLTPSTLLYVSQLQPFGGRGFLPGLVWWSTTCIAIYVAVPVGYALINGERIRGYGLSLAFLRTEASLFLLIAPVIGVLVWLVSADERFQRTYPFYRMVDGDPGATWKLIVFEILYGLSFVALEFYFRGFMVHAGAAVFGVHCVPVMAFFYCLLHLGKPMPECAASLIGGLILGYLSLKLRSIAVGVAAHLTLAWGVDAAVLSRK